MLCTAGILLLFCGGALGTSSSASQPGWDRPYSSWASWDQRQAVYPRPRSTWERPTWGQASQPTWRMGGGFCRSSAECAATEFCNARSRVCQASYAEGQTCYAAYAIDRDADRLCAYPSTCVRNRCASWAQTRDPTPARLPVWARSTGVRSCSMDWECLSGERCYKRYWESRQGYCQCRTDAGRDSQDCLARNTLNPMYPRPF